MKMFKTLALVLVIAALSILLLELIGQRLVFRDELYIVDNVDHRLRPTLLKQVNFDGIRSDVGAEHFQENHHNIVFLGDSYVYGWGLPLEDTVPALLQKKAREAMQDKQINVANFGWPSSSPLLSYRLLRDIGHKYKPDVVILAVDMTDFHDDIKYARLLERKGILQLLDYTPVTLIALQKLLLSLGLESLHEDIFGFPARRFFVTDQPLAASRPYLMHIQRNIDRINELSTFELDAKFVLLVLPRAYQYSDRETPNSWEQGVYENLGPFAHEPFRYFEEVAREADYPVISLLPAFQNTTVFPTTFDGDPHWNVEGSRVAAAAVYDACLQAGCFD